jgi:hypothetical protein
MMMGGIIFRRGLVRWDMNMAYGMGKSNDGDLGLDFGAFALGIWVEVHRRYCF